MKIFTVDTCDSTNTLLRDMLAGKEWLPGGTTLRAVTQTAGRGQRGNTWEAEPGMNLTFSMVLRPGAIEPKNHFILSEAVAVGVARFLQSELPPDIKVEVKWPNDILIDGRKIAGILIENTLDSSGCILHSIAGIGININQTLFGAGAPNATSLSGITGRYYDLEELQLKVATVIDSFVQRVAPLIMLKSKVEDFRNEIEDLYHSMLWRSEGSHRWRDAIDGSIFEASIVCVHPSGHLELRLPDDRRRRYLFKEVFPVD